MSKVVKVYTNLDLRHCAPGSIVKVAYERMSWGWSIGVILPNGDPWIFTDDLVPKEEMKQHIEERYLECNIEYISIKVHNRLKAEYCRKR